MEMRALAEEDVETTIIQCYDNKGREVKNIREKQLKLLKLKHTNQKWKFYLVRLTIN